MKKQRSIEILRLFRLAEAGIPLITDDLGETDAYLIAKYDGSLRYWTFICSSHDSVCTPRFSSFEDALIETKQVYLGLGKYLPDFPLTDAAVVILEALQNHCQSGEYHKALSSGIRWKNQTRKIMSF